MCTCPPATFGHLHILGGSTSFDDDTSLHRPIHHRTTPHLYAVVLPMLIPIPQCSLVALWMWRVEVEHLVLLHHNLFLHDSHQFCLLAMLPPIICISIIQVISSLLTMDPAVVLYHVHIAPCQYQSNISCTIHLYSLIMGINPR